MLPCQSGLQYRKYNFKRFNRMNFSALCTILIIFGPVTPEFLLLTITPFAAIRQKNWHITPNISEYPGPILTYFTDLVVVFGGDDYVIFVWQSPKGRCYGNQLNLGDVRRRRAERPLLFALAFNNGLANCQAAFRRFNGIFRLHGVQIWWTDVQQSRSLRC